MKGAAEVQCSLWSLKTGWLEREDLFLLIHILGKGRGVRARKNQVQSWAVSLGRC